jgi:ABC-type branched-subunit amino acid transport system permease subunit
LSAVRFDATTRALAMALAVLVVAGFFLPRWAQQLATIALGKGLVVLGLLLLMRAGLVSFGQGLYYCVGAYAAGILVQRAGISEALVLVVAGALASGLIAAVLGALLAGYRAIFFAMLSLAFSMILYGLLVKSSALGSTDGFNVEARTLAGMALGGGTSYLLFAFAGIVACLAAWGVHLYNQSLHGIVAPAIRDNELRVEYLGASVRAVVYRSYVLAAVVSGVGGGIVALSVGHIDPEFAFWTTSGEFVFVAILAGTGNVAAPFVGSLLFEGIRTVATQYSPNTWQMVLGIAMLAVIMFLPAGLWSLFERRLRT